MDNPMDCYCGTLDPTQPAGTFQCMQCRKRFHPDCRKNPVESPLKGDTFYKFHCSDCSEDKTEVYDRAAVSWQETVQLALYNLQLGGGGKCGYFRWKEHICAFIDKNWRNIFDAKRKKTSTWYGTVAGTLSSGCPKHFTSGTRELGALGWWKLTEMKPPTYYVEVPLANRRRRQQPRHDVLPPMMLDTKRSRRSKPFSLNAASELKAKRTAVLDTRGGRRRMTDPAEPDPQFPLTSDPASDTAAAATALLEIASSTSALPMVADESQPTEWMFESLSEPLPSPSVMLPTDPPLIKIEYSPYSPHSATVWQSPSASGSAVDPKPALLDESSAALGQSENSNPSASYVSSLSRRSSQMDEDSATSFSDSQWAVAVKVEVVEEEMETVSALIDHGDTDDSLEIDPGSLSPCAGNSNFELRRSPGMEELMENITDTHAASASSHPSEPSVQSDADDHEADSEGPSEAEVDDESGDEEEGEEEEEEGEGGRSEVKTLAQTASGRSARESRRRKRKREEEEQKKQEEAEKEEEIPSDLHLMTPYDENLLLRQLNALMGVEPVGTGDEPLPPWKLQQIAQARNRLRRKLIVRKLKRDNGLPVCDLDSTMTLLSQKYWGVEPQNTQSQSMASFSNGPPQTFARTLDRFLMSRRAASVEVEHRSFRTRLVGFEDDQLQPITSPYTMRVLKPFIRRDRETLPLKVKLLQEIVAYPHRCDPTWTPPPTASVDYCYVRPQHISSVNALSRAFFWPGIDLSECLQYPDFSCVVMYKKVVVAFAFMVPDVKHNEAYISFILTHPQWRGAGIATFMLYHLIQTCMGKDVTLHVSATNPAMLLYQRFGFKAEELCLDFYDKYFPLDSRECKHAVFMRLRR